MCWKKILNNSKQEEWKNTTIYFIVCTLFVFFILLVIGGRIYDEILPYSTYLENNDEEQFIKSLTTGMKIEQEFVSPNEFDCITLSCSNHEKILSGKIIVEVWNKNEETLIHIEEIETTTITFDIPVEIHLLEMGKQNVSYVIKVTAEDTEEEGIGFFGYLAKEWMERAIVNGNQVEYALSVGTHTHTHIFYLLLKVTFLLLLVGMVFLIYFLAWKKLRVEQYFLLLAIPMGMVLLCFLSVNSINDGEAHFARAYHYANVLLGVSGEDTDSVITMRKDDLDTLYISECQNARNAQNMWHIYENWKWMVEDRTLIEGVEWRSAGNTNIFVYLPSVIAITLSRLLGIGTYPMIYLAKIFSFVVYLIGIYLSIRIIPVGKLSMLFLAALPMSLQQATGITYDNITMIVLFLLTSLMIKAFLKGMPHQQWIMLALLCIFSGCCKGGIYTPLLTFLIFIPKERFSGLKKKILYILCVGVLTIFVTLVNYGETIGSYVRYNKVDTVHEEKGYRKDDILGDKELKAPKPSAFGVGYIFREPKTFIKLLVNTIICQVDYYIEGILGSRVAWAVEKLPVWCYILFGSVLLLSKNRIKEEPLKIEKRLRMGMLLSATMVILAFFILFMMETPVTYTYIWGIQGRYFIPIMTFILLAIRNNGILQESRAERMLYITFYIGFMLFLIGYFELFMIQTYR